MKRHQNYLIAANTFATLGYVSILFQWLWSFLILVYPLLLTKPDFLFPEEQTPIAADPATSLSPVMIVIAVAASLAILAITVVVLLRLPKTIGKKGEHITKTTAKKVVPVVTHHKKLSKKEHARLSYRLVNSIKVFLVVTPLIALIFAKPIDQISIEVIMTMALFCAICSAVYFITQQLIARISHTDIDKLW